MSLLSPWMLLGLLAIAVPVYVHLVRRNDERRIRFPSLMFIEKLTIVERARRTLRDRPLLALRCLAIVLATLAFAAPLYNSGENDADSAVASTVLLLDTSYSMGVGDKLERATEAAREAIDSAALRGKEQLALLAFSDTTNRLHDFSTDANSLNAALESLDPSPRVTRYAPAFEEASRLLNTVPQGLQRVVLISDLQQSAIEAATALRLPSTATLDIVTIDGAPSDNLAIVDATIASTDSVEHVIDATLRNTGTQVINDRRVRIVADGRVLGEHHVSLAPGEHEVVSSRLVLGTDSASRIRIEADQDDVAVDNLRTLAGIRGRRLRAVIAEPEAPRRNQSVYLRKALSVERSPGIAVSTVKATALEDAANLEEADILFLNDVSTSVDAEGQIAKFVNRGGGLVTVAGPHTRFLNSVDIPLMHPTTSANDAGALLVDAARDHPTGLSQLITSTLSNVRIRSWRPLPRDERVNVLATLDTGSALIAEIPATGGRHIAITTTIDPAWSNLALEPGFVDLVQSIVNYVTDRTHGVAAYDTGTTIELAVHANACPSGRFEQNESGRALTCSKLFDALENGMAVVEDPDGVAHRLMPGHTVFRAVQPGQHELHGYNQSLPIAVNTNSSESDFSPGNEAALRDRLDLVPPPLNAGAGMTAAGAARGRDLPWVLLLLAALVLSAEGVLATRLGAMRYAGQGRGVNTGQGAGI